MSDSLGTEKVYFVHVAQDLEVPDDLPEELKKAYKPLDEELKSDMQNMVKQYCSEKKWKVEYDVIEGNPFKELIHFSKIKNIDLIVVGRKDINEGSGVVPQKIARKAPCSVLFVTMGNRFIHSAIAVKIYY